MRSSAREWLESVAGREPDTVIVVAHPDDEALGLGSLLPKLRRAVLIHVADGAARDMEDAGEHGFARREDDVMPAAFLVLAHGIFENLPFVHELDWRWLAFLPPIGLIAGREAGLAAAAPVPIRA